MNSETETPCDVCGIEPMVGYAGSPLGPISIAYGKQCLTNGAEPLRLFQAALGCETEDELKSVLREGGLAEWAQSLSIYFDGRYVNIMEWAHG